MGTKKVKSVKKVQRIKTKQPGVYKNSVTNKYDDKYCYTIVDMATSKKKYMQKWCYGINSYKDAVSTLNELKGAKFKPSSKEITLKDAFELWKEKAIANQYSLITIRNTSQQCDMLAIGVNSNGQLGHIKYLRETKGRVDTRCAKDIHYICSYYWAMARIILWR